MSEIDRLVQAATKIGVQVTFHRAGYVSLNGGGSYLKQSFDGRQLLLRVALNNLAFRLSLAAVDWAEKSSAVHNAQRDLYSSEAA